MLKRNNAFGRRRHAGCAAALLLAACGKDAGGPPPPPEVSVITLAAARRSPSPTSCRAAPRRSASPKCARRSPASCRSACSPRAREVKAGEQLFQIDSGQLSRRAVVGRGRAQARRGAGRSPPSCSQERYAPLIAANAVSKQENDEAIAARARADADVAAARAAVDAARINVVYTQVLSPITGRIGRTLVTEGALVTSRTAERRSPPCSSSIPSTSTSRSPAPRCCGCSASSRTASW